MPNYIDGIEKSEIVASQEDVFISKIPGDCWKVKKYRDKFYFQYLSGELSGKLKVIRITESDYKICLSGQYNQEQLCIKFGVN